MHKTYSTLMLVFGVAGLWKRRKKFPAEQGLLPIGEGIEETDRGSLKRRQGRNMAAFALVGGALLFTHVHSNAPYANVAAGVYIHHTVMGFFALMIGAVKLLEDSWRERKTGWQTRALGWSYACLMLVMSVLLLNYNEGLPWFLGYRDLSLDAPHKGLIAPLGGDRAELTFDPVTTRIEVYLLKQSNNRPCPLEAGEVQAVVRVGTDTTAIPLEAVPETGGRFHFTGTATFLRGVPTFQPQVLVTEQSGGQARSRLADFEPWTDERIAVGQHSQAAYVCPMHPALGAGGPGTCAVCGMALVPNKPVRAAGKLHDNSYRMDLELSAPGRLSRTEEPIRLASNGPIRIADTRRNGSATSESTEERQGSAAEKAIYQPIKEPQAGQIVRLRLTPRRADGSVVSALEIVHTKKLHLIIASRDLAFFDHVHPEQQPDGALLLDYAFPLPGEFLLYADCTPTGDRNQVFRMPLVITGTPSAGHPLLPTPAPARTFGNYRVRLDMSPSPPQSLDETQLTFTVSENGVPVTDLEPFLGAGGHCVILSEDTKNYLHSHPLEMNGTRFGPSVTFHTVFPRPGLYKIWGQFLHHGKPLTADFTVRIP